MLGGGSKPAGTITTVQDVPEWLKPYITENIDKARGTRDQLLMQNQGALDTSENALSAFARGDSLNANPALGLLQGTASGSYLNSNPYLDAMYAKAARGVTDTYLNTTQPRTDAIFNGPGTMGGNTAYQQMVARNQYGLGENLGNLATSIYGGNYAQERQNQLGAQQSIGNLFSTGQQQQLAAAGALPGVASARTQNAMSPYTQYNSLFPNISQTSQPFFENKIGNLFGGALGGAALGRLFS
ncbi:MAG TPA: hypothetical protein VD994_03730 [Prosthecobacter sp.]|nr:hypothetical protein [Prosthecobacter sp.]